MKITSLFLLLSIVSVYSQPGPTIQVAPIVTSSGGGSATNGLGSISGANIASVTLSQNANGTSNAAVKLTNLVQHLTTNGAMSVIVTNDASGNTVVDIGGIGSSSGQFMFINLSSNQFDGAYGGIGMSANHAGGAGNSPANSEVTVNAFGTIALVGGQGTTGTHIQHGGRAFHRVTDYQQINGDPSTGGTTTSGGYAFPTEWKSNAIQLIHAPMIWGGYDSTNNGSILSKWSLRFSPDYWNIGDNWSESQETNNIQSFFYGIAANSSNFSTVDFKGSIFGGPVSELDVDTNAVFVTATATSSETSPNFQVGASGQSSGDFQVQQSGTVIVGLNRPARFELLDGTGNQTRSHSYIYGGPVDGGLIFSVGNVAIGGTSTAAATHDLELNKTGVIVAPTNAASFTTVASGGLHTIALNKPWTNDLNSRADMVINYWVPIASGSGNTNLLSVTNTTTGECYTNSSFGPNSSGGQMMVIPDLSPSDTGTISNFGLNQNIILTKGVWKLK